MQDIMESVNPKLPPISSKIGPNWATALHNTNIMCTLCKRRKVKAQLHYQTVACSWNIFFVETCKKFQVAIH